MQKEGMSAERADCGLGVQGGGCSGLSYHIRFDTQPRERDRIFEYGEVRVFVDPKSFIYLNGMTVDWEETLMQRGFVFQNPNAKKSCGCGSSFLLKCRKRMSGKGSGDELSESRNSDAALQVTNSEHQHHPHHRCWSCGDMRAEHFCAECGHVQPAEPTDFFSFFGLPRTVGTG